MSTVRFGAATDIGKVRGVNEDSMLQSPPLFVVADGMGGHSAGDVASRIAVESLARHVLEDSEALSAAVKQANREIYDRAEHDASLGGMGTTITALLAGESSVQIAHVGDSRAYLLRDGSLERITQDHTVVGRLVQQGRITEEDAEHHPQRSYLERALGVDPDVEVDMNVLDTKPGDRILLCSDGLYTMISETQIADVLLEVDDPEAAANRLCASAVEAGGADNVTAVVIDYPGERVRSSGPEAARKRSLPRWMILGAVALALVVLAGLVARSAMNNSFYVGVESGEVTVFRGVKGNLAGIGLSDAVERTGLRVSSLPGPEQSRLEEGIAAKDRSDADDIVDNLKQIAASQATPSPSPSVGGP